MRFTIPALPPRAPRLPLLLCAFALGCGSGGEAEVASPEPEVPTLTAEVMTIQPVSWPETVRAQGNLVADEVAVIGAKVEGRVAAVHVDLGDRVGPEAPLITLDDAEFRLAISQADAQTAQARAAVGMTAEDDVADLQPENAPPVREARAVWDEARAKRERWEELQGRNAVTEADLAEVIAAEDVAAARYASAVNSVREKIAMIGVRTAELDLARQRLADTVVQAPFGGVIQFRHVAPGTYVRVGEPVATLVSTSPLHFRGMLPERHARRLVIGQTVRLRIESVAAPREARVTRISPTLDDRSRALLFEAELDNSDGSLQTGLFAEAEVIVGPDAEGIVVPACAVVEFAGVEKVWTIVDGMACEQPVTTGGRRDGWIEITDGLGPGDRILVDGGAGRVARVDAAASSSVDYSVARPIVDGAPAPDTASDDAEAAGSRPDAAAGGE